MLRIDFFYFDRQSCQRCKETDRNLQDAISELGLKVKIKKHKLHDHEEYVEGFGKVVSPSIFLDGKDIFLKTNTSSCDECSSLCGKAVHCRAESDDSDPFTKGGIKKAISEAVS
ncbi:MAG: DUF2703 domain-containing protein [Patescibacteria group bacterium]